ncbi:MAG: hypothetical protein KAU02_00445 [Tenericutes bacterium]|nr:hypothetical protein [Mycoplasmatota bacterium]
MKRLVLLLFITVLSFLLVGCNNGGSELDIDLNEFINSPTNLSISGKTLSWDEVENADGYLVYVDGEEEDSVNTNGFDFSGLTGENLIFQVKTKAPRGMQDSGVSASIAYVANPTIEIYAINSAYSAMISSLSDNNLVELPFSLPEGFPEELVRKGMIGSEFETIMTSLVSLQTNIVTTTTVNEQFDLFDAFLSSIDNVEAFVSASVVTLLADMIQFQIYELQSDLLLYGEYFANANDEYFEEYYQNLINQATLTLEALNALKTEIEDNPDSIVMSITTTIEYFVSIEEMLSSDLFTYLQSLFEATEPDDVNVNELVLIKEEIVNVLRETMPSQEDMSLMFQFYSVFQTLTNTTVNLDIEVDNYSGKLAAQALLTLEATINYLDTFDEAYFNDFIDVTRLDVSFELISVELAILSIEYFKEFKDSNQALLDSISDIFTDEEKELLFDDYLAVLISGDIVGDEYQIIYSGLVEVNFQTILHLQSVYGDAFDAALDVFVERGGEVIRQLVILQNYGMDYFEDTYVNFATNDVYENDYEFNSERMKTNYKVLEEVFYILEATIDIFNDEDYGKFIELIFDLIPVEAFFGSGFDSQFTESTLELIKGLIEETMDNSKADQLELFQNIVGYVVDEEVFANFYSVEEDRFAYLESVYGYDATDDSYLQYGYTIEMAKVYDDFMSSANRGLVDDILTEFILALYDTNFQSITLLEDTEIDFIDQNIANLLDYIKDELGTIADLDASNLSEDDILTILSFESEVQSRLLMISVDPDSTKN